MLTPRIQFGQRRGTERGYVILVLTIIFAAIGLALVLGGAVPIISHMATVRGYGYSKQAFLASNSAVNEAVYRLQNSMNLPAAVTITLGSSTASITTTAIPTGKKVTVSGSDASYVHNLVADLSYASGVAFNYGLQAGVSGVNMSGGSTINGNIYSNGPINAVSATITGTAVSADPTGFIGGASYVGGVQIGTGGAGDAWAHTVKGASVSGSLYCTTGTYNNKSCNTSKGDAPEIALPYTDQNIADWKADAQTGGTTSGSVHVDWHNMTLGPREITGNLLIDGGGTLTMTGTLYVHGTVTVTGGGKIVLPASFGENSATIVSDGTMSINGGGSAGSGDSASYLFLVTTNSSNPAISVTGGAGAIAVSAQNGTVSLAGGCQIKAATAKYITVSGGSTVNYDAGLASPVFQSGPSGGYAIVNWKEN